MSDLDLPLAVRMMQDGYLMEIQDLKEKNEQLRKERDMYRDLVGMMDHPDLNVQLSAENEKLRELVRGLVYATHPADRARLIADAAELVGELGVEV